MTSRATDVFAGDFSQVMIGQRLDLTIKVLTERYAENGQVGLSGVLARRRAGCAAGCPYLLSRSPGCPVMAAGLSGRLMPSVGMDHATYEYPVDPGSRNEWSTPAGVIIDGACYQLEGEPLPYAPSVHFGGNGQR